MFMKGLLSMMVFSLGMVFCTPQLMAEESAKDVDEVVTWWEEYGKYWKKVEADEQNKKDVASADN